MVAGFKLNREILFRDCIDEALHGGPLLPTPLKMGTSNCYLGLLVSTCHAPWWPGGAYLGYQWLGAKSTVYDPIGECPKQLQLT